MRINKKTVPISPGPFNIWIYGKGLIRGYVLSLLLFLISAILITYTFIGEGLIPIITSIILILGVAYASIYSAIKVGVRGWLHGALVGLVYILILLLFSKFFVSGFVFDRYVIYKIVISVFTGVVGGMIGINIK
ncbi:TIGR04086 family membrane protein [Alkaliphilus peptidifermentans]|uniref:Putative membrane protein, TIGR04086 family n=1 Tax=Alkaliphilus peptidifermentans DSM 18978 TaxID=1120976 RepID=A0A1G5L386_9FIRM|nr:TIGR04086 family membrane protein [Alkaliphilus peptidifermentans]SCZ07317.1 putative membrane protein, TIGR04086 family [Alkaliphilus peptidifermentans DSM 18978]